MDCLGRQFGWVPAEAQDTPAMCVSAPAVLWTLVAGPAAPRDELGHVLTTLHAWKFLPLDLKSPRVRPPAMVAMGLEGLLWCLTWSRPFLGFWKVELSCQPQVPAVHADFIIN